MDIDTDATRAAIPAGFPVQPLQAGEAATDQASDGACGLSWDDATGTAYTPAPSGRCPFEVFHVETEPADPDEVLHHVTVADVENLHAMVLTEDQAEQVKDRLAQALTHAINEIRGIDPDDITSTDELAFERGFCATAAKRLHPPPQRRQNPVKLTKAQIDAAPLCSNCFGYVAVPDCKIVLRQRGWVHLGTNSVRCAGQDDDSTDDRADPMIRGGQYVTDVDDDTAVGDIGARSALRSVHRVAALNPDGETRPDGEPFERERGDAVRALNALIAQARDLTVPDVRPGDLLVSYEDIRECLVLILGVTTDPQEILSSLHDAVSNNLGE